MLNVKMYSFCVFFLLFDISLAFTLRSLDGLKPKDDDDGDDDDDDGFGTSAIIGLAIGILAILIAVPVLLCFCCGCFCFKQRQSKNLGEPAPTPAATKKDETKKPTSANNPNSNNPNAISEDQRKGSSLTIGTRRDSQLSNGNFVSAPAFPDDMAKFYFNLGYEPPPPYGVDAFSDEAWEVASSVGGGSRFASPRPSTVPIPNEYQQQPDKLRPSLLKGSLG